MPRAIGIRPEVGRLHGKTSAGRKCRGQWPVADHRGKPGPTARGTAPIASRTSQNSVTNSKLAYEHGEGAGRDRLKLRAKPANRGATPRLRWLKSVQAFWSYNRPFCERAASLALAFGFARAFCSATFGVRHANAGSFLPRTISFGGSLGQGTDPDSRTFT